MSPDAKERTILLLQGDAESSLLADAEAALEAVFPDRGVRLLRAWMSRPDWLNSPEVYAPQSLVRSGALPADDACALLELEHRTVIFSLLPAISLPSLHHVEGGAFLAHRGLTAGWSPEIADRVAAECRQEEPLSPDAAVAALEMLIDGLHSKGTAVAVCTAFRHVLEPLEHRQSKSLALRDRIRRLNVEIARLSNRTGCFVLDIDRVLAQEGGRSLQTDCFGGTGRAAELAIDEFLATLLDARPDDFMPEDDTPKEGV